MKALKKSVLIISFCLFCLPATFMLAQSTAVPQLGKASVKQVVAAMTLEEKASLVVGKGRRTAPAPSATPGAAPAPAAAPTAAPTAPVIGQTQDLVPGAAGTTFDIPRLGITSMVLADGPAGLRISPTRQDDKNTYYCTAFPVGTLLASTWDVDLVSKVGQAMGNEVKEYGNDVLLAPGVNIHRNPLCGRNFEYYSEDPFVVGKIAAAMINGVESQGVGTSIKHFAANNAETNRNSLDTYVSERALREIYLEGFRIAIQDAQPWTVMTSYNLINGTYTAETYDLVTKILRNDWGFKGYVMTDWGGGRNWVAEMKAGNDLIMPGSRAQVDSIVKAVKIGTLDVKDLDRNVERILNVMLMSPRFKGYKYSNKPDLKAHAEVTRQSAAEGMVLLKNTNLALPLADTTVEVAAFGNTSYRIITGGTGSGDVNEAYSVSLVEGLQNVGLTANATLKTMYDAYLKAVDDGRPRGPRGFRGADPIGELGVSVALAKSMANISDVALITIGRNSGEGRDRSSGEGDFKLSAAEKDLLKNVTDEFHAVGKKVIVVLNVGGVVETASWKDIPDAILLAWQAGQETGNSIADILKGKVNPSGKIATTFPVNYEDNPSSVTFPGKEKPSNLPAENTTGGFMRGRPAEITYEDGIYVGYRYYETFGVKTSYEFGYGLSYTTFEYSNIKLSSPQFSKQMTVTVDVKNTGKVAGKEVAQLYLTAPAGKLDKPAMELKGFAKTRLLQPGESQTLTFTIDGHNLASFDPEVSAWIADAGTYAVKVGASSKDIKQNATFSLDKSLTVKKESVAMVSKVKINELKPKM
jgi:beta-glucosidase